MKKILSAVTASVLLLASTCCEAFGMSSSASEETISLTYSIASDGASVTGFSGSGSELVIPDTVEGVPVISISSEAFSGCSTLVNASVPDSVTSIGSNAFRNCSNLKAIDLGDGVSSIGSYAFFGNSSLEAITLPDSLETISEYSFAGCLSLEKILIPSSVTSLGKGSFMNCSSLAQVTLSVGITSIPDQCFSMCTALSGVNISPIIKSIGTEAFYCCAKLSGIEIPTEVTAIYTNALGTHYNMMNQEISPIRGFYISGKKGTAAELYAKRSGVEFIDFSDISYGDTDGDGAVNSSDASMVLREYTRVATGVPSSFTYYQSLTGDYNRDGVIDASDASLILKKYTETATGG